MSRAQIPTPEEQGEYKRSAAEVRRSLNFSTYYFYNPPPSAMPTVDPGIAQRFGVEEVGSIFWPCFLAVVLGVIDWYRHSSSVHAVIVAIGVAASLVIPLLLVIHCVKAIQRRSRPAVVFLAFYTTASFVPYLFALYLILFLGLYSVVMQFSFSQLIQSLLFVVAGHYIARRIRRLQEFQSCVYEQFA